MRPLAARQYHELEVTSDVYALPAPKQVVVASLGYRAALADLLYGHVLVSYGIHVQEKRRFEFVGSYLDTINALDPEFRQPYLIADTLLTLSTVAPERRDFEKAREILERGLDNLPYDAEVWLVAGQYMAYIAPPHLGQEKLAEAWRLRGAKVLARACELASDNENIPYHCITAAKLFSDAGKRDAAIRSLRRLLAVNDDPAIVEQALGYLQVKLSEREQERQRMRLEAFREVWQDDLPFVSKDLLLVLSPPTRPAACAGPDRAEAVECASSWAAWAEHLERRLPGGTRDE